MTINSRVKTARKLRTEIFVYRMRRVRIWTQHEGCSGTPRQIVTKAQSLEMKTETNYDGNNTSTKGKKQTLEKSRDKLWRNLDVWKRKLWRKELPKVKAVNTDVNTPTDDESRDDQVMKKIRWLKLNTRHNHFENIMEKKKKKRHLCWK